METKTKRLLRLKEVGGNNKTNYYQEVACEVKYVAATSMRSQLEQLFEMDLQKIEQLVGWKFGTKKKGKSV